MKKRKMIKGSIVLIMSFFIFVSSINVIATAEESRIEKKETSYDIAVVFDNSGSMYKDGPRNRWSYAKYAMGVFASMLDYKKDKLTIFPMWSITHNSKKTGATNRLDITSSSDIEKLGYIYTPNPDYTPIDVCNRAKSYLDSSSKDEKWLVILTDGGFTKKDLSSVTEKSVKDTINSFKRNGIKVHFLSFGESAKLYDIADNEKVFNNKSKNAEDLKDKLIDICNSIFQRNELESDFFNKNTGEINLEVSSNYLFVFAQGKSDGIDLKNENGQQISISQSTTIRTDKDETYSAGESPGKSINYTKLVRQYKNKLPNLTGTIVTFKNCPKGKYKLTGVSEKVQVFYEPDVYVDVAIKKDGKRLKQTDLDKGLNPEDYEIEYALYDSKTKKPVPKAAKLNEKLKAFVNDGNKTKEYNSGDKLQFEPEKNVDIEVKGDYLNGKYKISSNENESINLKGIKVFSEKEFYKVKVNVKQLAGLYTLMEHDGWRPIRVDITRDGKKLTEEELKDVKISFSEKIPYSAKMLVNESAYEINIGKTKNGKYIEPKAGNYKVTASIKHADEHGREMTGSDSSGFRITPLPAWLVWLIWILAILLLIALIIFILNLPAWPARMVCVIEKPARSKGSTRITRSNISVTLVTHRYALSASIKKNSKLINKWGKKANVKVESIEPHNRIQSYTIGSKTYTRNNHFLDSDGKPFTGIIRNGTQISMTFTSSEPLSAKIKIN